MFKDLLVPVLKWINSIVHNYGVTVIIFTLVLKLILLPLDLKQRKVSRRMSAIQPKIDALNKKYANDKEKLSQKTVELYRQEGVSPFSGCLPLLITLPILIIMLNVLRQFANEMTINMYNYIKAGNLEQFTTLMKESRFLWIQNLWQPDSLFGAGSKILPTANTFGTLLKQTGEEQIAAIAEVLKGKGEFVSILSYYAESMNGLFILPIIAAVTQFIQSKYLMPQPNSSSSQNSSMAMMTYFMPIMSLWICSSSTSAFSLYWVFSNLFSMAQALILNKIYDGKFFIRTDKGGKS